MIKNLITNAAIVNNPINIGAKILSFEFPKFNFIYKFCPKTARINNRYIKPGLYDGIEYGLWSSGVFDKDWEIDHSTLNKIKKQNLPINAFHGCYETFPKKYHGIYFNLASGSKSTLKALRSQLQVVKELKKGSTAVVFHCGYVKSKKNKKQGIKNVIDNLSKVLDYCYKNKIILTLENNIYNSKYCILGTNAEEILHIIRTINHPNLKITFDWGHLNTIVANKTKTNQTDSFTHINEFIDKCKKDIVHAHLHYNLSHCRSSFYKKDKFDKITVRLLSFLEIVKYQSEGIDDPNDMHLPLFLVGSKYRTHFNQTIQNLITKTSIAKHGYVTHELIPKRIFHFFNISQYGVDIEGHEKNLSLFNSIVNK